MKQLRSILLASALAILIALSNPRFARANIVFSDVGDSTPHVEEILWAANNSISEGWLEPDHTRTFRGMEPITRQDMAAFLRRLAVLLGDEAAASYVPNEADLSYFSDVDEDTPHYEDILWLANKEISEGWEERDGTRTFRGMDSVKRQDMAAFLRRFAILFDVREARLFRPNNGVDSRFLDVDWDTPHHNDIWWLAVTGITTGYENGNYEGMWPVYRQDMAAFLYRINVYCEGSLLETPDGLCFYIVQGERTLSPQSALASTRAYNPTRYVGDGIYIVGYEGETRELAIPLMLRGRPVVSVDLTDTSLRGGISSLDTSEATQLKHLNCNGRSIGSTLDLTGQASLESVLCSGGKLSALRIDGCTNLRELNCADNQLTLLDTRPATSLKELDCRDNPLTSLYYPDGLTALRCEGTYLEALDITSLEQLVSLSCGGAYFSSLKIGSNQFLEEAYCDVSGMTFGTISPMDFRSCKSLRSLEIACIEDFALYVDHLPELERLRVDGVWANDVCGITSLDLTGCSSLSYLRLDNLKLDSVDVTGLPIIEIDVSSVAVHGLSGSKTLEHAILNYGGIDYDLSGCENLISLELIGNSWPASNLCLDGCTSLETLNCSRNVLKELDISSCTSLRELNCSNSYIEILWLPKSNTLQTIICSSNRLGNLDLTSQNALTSLKCNSNKLAALDITGCPLLEELYCQHNLIEDTAELVDWLIVPGHTGQVDPQDV